jgi:hypothetical protein
LPSHSNEVRNVAPHFCGNERPQQINLPIAGGKFLPAHGSYREFIEIMVSEWRRVSRNSHFLNLTVASSAFFFIKATPGTERSVQLQLSFNDNWENILVH